MPRVTTKDGTTDVNPATAVADLLSDLGVSPPAQHENTLYAALRRSAKRDYRDRLARACWGHSMGAAGGSPPWFSTT